MEILCFIKRRCCGAPSEPEPHLHLAAVSAIISLTKDHKRKVDVSKDVEEVTAFGRYAIAHELLGYRGS
jgi:hypothetical protein